MSDYLNQGTMWHNSEKKHPKAPDFNGTISLDKDYVQQLLNESTGGKVDLKLDLWKDKRNVKGTEKAILSAKVNTWKPEMSSAPSAAKDPWDE